MNCPFCGRNNQNLMRIDFVDKIDWLRCPCGSVYQVEPKECEVYGKEYLEVYKKNRFYDRVAQYPTKVYFPIIEEATYGRKMLEIDSIDLEVTKEAQRRGWVCYSTGDQETKDCISAKDKELKFFNDAEFPEEAGFDLIYSYHNIEKSDNQAKFIAKCFKLLNGGGCLFLATPDMDFIDYDGVLEFGHFYKENKLMMNMRRVIKELERFGFDVIVRKQNTSPRFLKNNDMHIIAQKG